MREDCGDYEDIYFDEKDIRVDYLFLVTEEDIKEDKNMADADWYVGHKEISDYSVFILNV